MTSAALSSLLAPLVDGPTRPCTVIAATSVSWHVHIDATGRLEQEPEVALISMQLPRAERLPCSLLVDTPPRIRVGDRGRIGRGLVRLGSLDATPARWFRPARPRILALTTFLAGCRDLPMIEPDDIGLAHCTLGRPTELLGRGPGLTPAGDDVLAARLVVRHALGAPAPGWLPSSLSALTTPLSAQLLRCAVRGFCCDRLASLMWALDRGDDPTEAARRLSALGGTTGMAMLMGLKYAANQFIQSRAA
jgi:Protein of unknown function (DUF2877)